MNQSAHQQKMETYYRWHAPVYDATRWSFLFGRRRLIDQLPSLPRAPRILEVGCGTGRNLRHFAERFPDAEITGLDISAPMLQQAARKTEKHRQIDLLHGRYGSDSFAFNPFDLIFLSYSVTMIGDNLKATLQNLSTDLKDSGHIAVVDFHQTGLSWFERWMQANHVRMDGALLPLLDEHYQPTHRSVHPAYGGWWSYFMFIGKKL